jgi:hypothetical protein
MNELEQKLGLIELSPEERLYKNPNATNLSCIPKTRQTLEMLIDVCQHDGLALKYASKRLITYELCEIAVKQNGLALEYVPEKIFANARKQWIVALYASAVKSNGLALEFVPGAYITATMVEQAVQYYYIYRNNTPEQLEKAKKQGAELHEWKKYPIAFVPKALLSADVIKKAVSYSPFCLKDVDNRRITKELAYLAVKTNGLSIKHIPERLITAELAVFAAESAPLSIQYIPKDFITQEMCDSCIRADYVTFAYLPEEYVTEEMCLKAADSKVFSIFRLSPKEKERSFGNANIKLIYFRDFPEEMRNNQKVLDHIIKHYKYGALPLIKWSESIEEDVKENGLLGVETDARGNPIIPLKKETIEYLFPKVIQPKGENRLSTTGNFMPSVYVREMKKQSESITLPIPESASDTTALMIQNTNTAVTHELAEELSSQTIYYITDIHIEHHLLWDDKLRRKLKNAKSDIDKQTAIKSWIECKVLELISGADNRNMLLIGGDVASGVSLSETFYKCLLNHWTGTIISVLGNHELWDDTTPADWSNPEFKSRSVEEIISDYKDSHYDYKDILLENELYLLYQNQKPCILSENDIKNASEPTLTEFLAKCSTIILGGIGYSGLNPENNAEYLAGHQITAGMGLYRTAIKSLEEDRRRSEAFRCIYEKVLRCARGKKVIVLTHTQIEDWTSDQPSPSCIYVNGHTHCNTMRRTSDEIAVLSDNQIGYGLDNGKYMNPKWKLNSFVTDKLWYDPFENDPDGIYTISSERYKEFNRGRGIMSEGCSYNGTLYMLKRSGMYMFLLETSASLCLLSGGKRNKLRIRDIHYYYDNMETYSDRIREMIKPYQTVMQQLSKEVRMIGGSGAIHGCIVDMDFFNHIYVNPFDGKVTSYFAYDICGRQVFNSIYKHIEQQAPQFLLKYLQECEKKSIPLLGKFRDAKKQKTDIAVLPEWMTGTEIYEPSRAMRAVQYVWEQNVIRVWNDDVLNKEAGAKLQVQQERKQISNRK